MRFVIGRRGLSTAALKSIFDVGVSGDHRRGHHNEGRNRYESFPDGHGDDLPMSAIVITDVLDSIELGDRVRDIAQQSFPE
jgi:hypothetical protein